MVATFWIVKRDLGGGQFSYLHRPREGRADALFTYPTLDGAWPFLSLRKARDQAKMWPRSKVYRVTRLPNVQVPPWVKLRRSGDVTVVRCEGDGVWEYNFCVMAVGSMSLDNWARHHENRPRLSGSFLAAPIDVWAEAAVRAARLLRRSK